MLPRYLELPAAILLLLSQHVKAEVQHPFQFTSAWQRLLERVEDRIFVGKPFAQPCYGGDSESCNAVRHIYLDELSRSNVSSAYINTQWETCQFTEEKCLLDYTNPFSDAPTSSGHKCMLGSVPQHFIDVRDHEDVIAAFDFSRETKSTLIIKNTGHDYKGRSSAPNSLALWTHNLKNISYHSNFVAEGCSSSHQAITMGAGVQFEQLYNFADAHNVTVVGGSDKSVGASGGWLQGGGHGSLSNTMGLGVDRVLQFKVVTPDGEYRIANACQNKDLFFALRGGGGGTFGVVLESTIMASPRVTLQTVLVAFPADADRTKALWSTMIDNSLQWSKDGWGGIAVSNISIYINPVLNKAEAAKSMAPLIDLGNTLKDQGAIVIATEFDSWMSFFEFFTASNVAITGVNLALTSRLINKGSFETAEKREALLDGMLNVAKETPRTIILVSAPASHPGDGLTSVTEAWRDSLWHVTTVSSWNWNATRQEIQEQYKLTSKSMDHLRRITPDAAYQNEADVYEPNHEATFWGTNYDKLLAIKQKYDPDHLLDCWHCVGWKKNSPRFSCYLPGGNLDDNLDVNSWM